MPIRTLPLAAITLEHVEDMIRRGVREDHTLDFKQEIRLSDSGKLDVLGDITAMANASGGTILYGAVEGDDDATKGVIVGLAPMQMAVDRLMLDLEHLLRDNVRERLPGVEFRAIPAGGDHIFVIRVAPSALAPHMVTLRSSRDRFFLRGAVSSQPMDARQIREVALRSATAFERAQECIPKCCSAVAVEAKGRDRRLARTAAEVGPESMVLHLLPLLPPAGGLDLSGRALLTRWSALSAFGWRSTNAEMSLDGL
jgi:hypothetical protein